LFSLALNLIAFLEPLYPSGGIHHAPFTGKKRMAIAAHLDLNLLLGRAGGKPVTACANYFGVTIIFGMNLLFHGFQLFKTLTFLLSLLVASYLTIPLIVA
jgi:hypothetical protein